MSHGWQSEATDGPTGGWGLFSFSLFLSLSLSIYLPTYLPIYVSIYLSIYLSIYPSIDPSIYPSIHPSIYLSIYLSYLSIHPSLIYLSIYLSMSLSLSPSNYLSIYLSMSLSLSISRARFLSHLITYLSIYLSVCLSIFGNSYHQKANETRPQTCSLSNTDSQQLSPAARGTWCSGITSAPHAEGPCRELSLGAQPYLLRHICSDMANPFEIFSPALARGHFVNLQQQRLSFMRQAPGWAFACVQQKHLTSASHGGRQFDPGQVYFSIAVPKVRSKVRPGGARRG